MSLYYKEKPYYLDMALKSVFEQITLPRQVVLVLDGPIGKELQAVVETYKKTYSTLDVYAQKENRGLSTALNIGLTKCKYEIVFRMDTDDICYPERFKEILSIYDANPNLDIVGSFATMIDKNGKVIKEMTVPRSENEIYKKVWTCPFIHPTVSFRKSSIMKVGGYNPNSGPRQDDYELWFRCIEGGLHCMNLNKPLLYYRFFRDSVAKNDVNVGWWRLKVGLKGSIKCKCSPISYVGVAYPFVRSLMPRCLRELMYRVSDKINPRTN